MAALWQLAQQGLAGGCRSCRGARRAGHPRRKRPALAGGGLAACAPSAPLAGLRAGQAGVALAGEEVPAHGLHGQLHLKRAHCPAGAALAAYSGER